MNIGYNENSIRVLTAEEASRQSIFGIQEMLANNHPELERRHIEKVAQALFMTRVSPSLYERKYCSPVGEVASDDAFTQQERAELSSLLLAFTSIH